MRELRDDQINDGRHSADVISDFALKAAIENADALLGSDPALNTEARREYESLRAEAVAMLAARNRSAK